MVSRRRWYRSWKSAITLLSCSFVLLVIYTIFSKPAPERAADLVIMEKKLKQALKLEKGLGCEISELDPFAPGITGFNEKLPKIKCSGIDWVKCYHSECRVVDRIMETVENIMCEYRDIFFLDNQKYGTGPVRRSEDGSYVLRESDHAKVSCRGTRIFDNKKLEWSGYVIGFRSSVKLAHPPLGHEEYFNVLIFAFDTLSRNGFIRSMPKSWKVITEELGATVMEGYNTVGDGTLATLLPILTGNTEMELPDVHRRNNGDPLDSFPFMFYKLKDNGYRTAFFEDRPDIAASHYHFNDFRRQPMDHSFRASSAAQAANNRSKQYCIGDTPQYKLLMNLTEQFMEFVSNRFIFTLISDITHDENQVQVADDDTAAMLRRLQRYKYDTLLVLMGTHGPRFSKDRETLQSKLEERLPLLALVLPSKLVEARPEALTALRDNARTLTTPHDLHTTLLDVLGIIEYANSFRVQEDSFERGLSMLEKIPPNRTCTEAEVYPPWCTCLGCLSWETVPYTDPLHDKASLALLDFINRLLTKAGHKCVPRTLLSTEWVFRRRPSSHFLSSGLSTAADGSYSPIDAGTYTESYQIKVLLGPGRAVFEATLKYLLKAGQFLIHTSDISRTNAYGNEPDCLGRTHPELNYYCYCRR